MDVLQKQYQRHNPSKPDADPKQSIVTRNLQDVSIANVRPALLILTGAVAFVLLIACVNIACRWCLALWFEEKRSRFAAHSGPHEETLFGNR